MARPSKLSDLQCAKARTMRTEHPRRWSVPKLAKHFKVSESSMYKVFDGTYAARQEANPSNVPTVTPIVPRGATPSLFNRSSDYNHFDEPDEITLAAAQLIVARSRFASMLRH